MNFEPSEEVGEEFASNVFAETKDAVKQEVADMERVPPKHPITVCVHILLKVLALLCYLFLYWVLGKSKAVVAMVVVILLSAVDFWTTKNITGRLLVGLRWWNQIQSDKKSRWVFESLEKKNKWKISSFETAVFWGSLIVALLLWVLFAVVSLLKLNVDWLTICIVSIVLLLTNFVGFFKCARDSRKKLRKKAGKIAATAAVNTMVGQIDKK